MVEVTGLDQGLGSARGDQTALKDVDRADELSAETAVRVLVDLTRATDLNKLTAIHDGNTISHSHGLFLIVSHHQAGNTHRVDDVHQLEAHLFT